MPKASAAFHDLRGQEVDFVRAKALLDQGHVTRVGTCFFGAVMLCDEDAALRQLPLNKDASALCGTDLYGPCILTDSPEWTSDAR